jgi:hypothetical protein
LVFLRVADHPLVSMPGFVATGPFWLRPFFIQVDEYFSMTTGASMQVIA